MTAAPVLTGLSRLSGTVHAHGSLWASPPSDQQEFDSVSVSPGLPAFYVMFVLAVVVVLLGLDLTRRVRRIQAQERAEQRLAEEDAAAVDGEGADGENASVGDEQTGSAAGDEDEPAQDDAAGDTDTGSAAGDVDGDGDDFRDDGDGAPRP